MGSILMLTNKDGAEDVQGAVSHLHTSTLQWPKSAALTVCQPSNAGRTVTHFSFHPRGAQPRHASMRGHASSRAGKPRKFQDSQSSPCRHGVLIRAVRAYADNTRLRVYKHKNNRYAKKHNRMQACAVLPHHAGVPQFPRPAA